MFFLREQLFSAPIDLKKKNQNYFATVHGSSHRMVFLFSPFRSSRESNNILLETFVPTIIDDYNYYYYFNWILLWRIVYRRENVIPERDESGPVCQVRSSNTLRITRWIVRTIVPKKSSFRGYFFKLVHCLTIAVLGLRRNIIRGRSRLTYIYNVKKKPLWRFFDVENVPVYLKRTTCTRSRGLLMFQLRILFIHGSFYYVGDNFFFFFF